MRGVLVKAAISAMCLASSASFAAGRSDWPQFRGPNADGMSPATGINKDWNNKPPKLLWKIPMGDRGFAGPSAAEGRVYIIDHKGKQDVVRAIDIKTGKDAWTFEYEDSPKQNYGFARATPIVADGWLYTLSRLGVLHCLHRKSGTKAWSTDIIKAFRGKRPTWQMAMSPLVDGDVVVVAPGGPNAAVAALNRKTGKTIWKGGGSDRPGYATPVAATINGRKQYVVFTAYNLIGVDVRTGKTLWTFPWKTKHDVNAATPIVSGDTVFITSNYGCGGVLLRIDGHRATPVWKNKSI